MTTDPRIPEDERMTPAEFQMARELLGLSGPWLAQHLGVSYKTIQHWQSGKYAIPEGVQMEMEDLGRRTVDYIKLLVEQLRSASAPEAVTYRTDEEYAAAALASLVPESSRLPASWHRMAVARVALEIPALSVVYAAQPSPAEGGAR